MNVSLPRFDTMFDGEKPNAHSFHRQKCYQIEYKTVQIVMNYPFFK